MERSIGQSIVREAVSVVGGTSGIGFAQKQSKVATLAALCKAPGGGYKIRMPDSGEIRHSLYGACQKITQAFASFSHSPSRYSALAR